MEVTSCVREYGSRSGVVLGALSSGALWYSPQVAQEGGLSVAEWVKKGSIRLADEDQKITQWVSRWPRAGVAPEIQNGRQEIHLTSSSLASKHPRHDETHLQFPSTSISARRSSQFLFLTVSAPLWR